MPKKRALLGRGRKRSDPNARGAPDGRNGPRKKLPLDALLNQNVTELLSGYTMEELNELQDKISELGSEILEALEFDVEVEEIIGVKLDNESLWFYVRWEDNDCSLVPSKILHKIAPAKVIKFYENRLQFASPNNKKEEPTGVENLQLRIPNGGEFVDKLTSRMLAERQIEEQREQQLLLLQQQQQQQQPARDGPNRIGTNITSSQGPPLKKIKTDFPPTSSPNNGIPKAGQQKNFRKMNCTGCGILLQYPENTKAIKCPACSTVMHAR